jgi:hypothetical protein
MKDLNQLIDEVRDFNEAAKDNLVPAAHEEYWKHGHRAACDRLIPALKEAIESLSVLEATKGADIFMIGSISPVTATARNSLQKICALLESKETKE